MKLLVLVGLIGFVGFVDARSGKLLDSGKLVNETVEAGSRYIPAMGAEMVSYINNDDSIPFLAKRYKRFENKTNDHLKNYLGLLTDPEIEKAKTDAADAHSRTKRAAIEAAAAGATSLPLNFTINTNWPNCATTFNTIQDQSNCGSCWAVSSASVMQDRRCIVYNTAETSMSAWDLVSCCTACQGTSGNGCDGGYPSQAFNYFDKTGVVTGDKYGSGIGCKPYPIAPNAASQPSSTTCSASCQSSYRTAYSADKKKGTTYQVFSNNNTAVMQEIFSHGSVVATYAVYQDFYQYSSGVYQHSTGSLVGYHAVRVVGWGQTAAGVKYWRVANSWGTSWGMGGFFNIVRGTNNCGFEAGIVSGTALKD